MHVAGRAGRTKNNTYNFMQIEISLSFFDYSSPDRCGDAFQLFLHDK